MGRREYSIPAEGIKAEVMDKYIGRCLGPGSTFKMGRDKEGEHYYVYFAYTRFTEEQIKDLKSRSQARSSRVNETSTPVRIENQPSNPQSRSSQPVPVQPNLSRDTGKRGDDDEKEDLNDDGEDDSEGEEHFRKVMKIKDRSGNYRDAMGLLDTQCHGNWMSFRLVSRLKLEKNVSELQNPVSRMSACGIVSAKHVIKPTWRFKSGGSIHDEYTFFIFETKMLNIDILLGVQILVELHIVTVNTDNEVMLPLLPHKKERLSEKARRTILEEDRRQKQEKYENERPPYTFQSTPDRSSQEYGNFASQNISFSQTHQSANPLTPPQSANQQPYHNQQTIKPYTYANLPQDQMVGQNASSPNFQLSTMNPNCYPTAFAAAPFQALTSQNSSYHPTVLPTSQMTSRPTVNYPSTLPSSQASQNPAYPTSARNMPQTTQASGYLSSPQPLPSQDEQTLSSSEYDDDDEFDGKSDIEMADTPNPPRKRRESSTQSKDRPKKKSNRKKFLF